MKVLICGDRNWDDRQAIAKCIFGLKDEGYDTIIEGDCRGADRIAGDCAESLGLTVLKFPAQWHRYGRGAGVIRNTQMLDEGQPDLVVYFHYDLTKSRGTANMVSQARKRHIEVRKG